MKFRSAAREIALLAASYIDRSMGSLQKDNFEDILFYSIKILTEEAKETIKDIKSSLTETKEYVETYQLNHEDNLNLPIDREVVSVPLHQSKEVVEHLSHTVSHCENLLSSIELFELCAYSQKVEIKEYAFRLIQAFKENETFVKECLQNYSIDWNVSRIYKIDRLILSMAIIEILFFDDIPDAVAIDEALILAARYSSVESKPFINGILGKISQEKNFIRQNYSPV